MFKLNADFKLIEHDVCYKLTSLGPLAIDEQLNYIQLNCQLENNGPLVSKMLKAMIIGQQQDIPVIFNRNGQAFDCEDVPNTFKIGLFTSGTTGTPKLIFHSIDSLLPKNSKTYTESTRWLLCYNPMSFAGIQVILQAIVSNDTLIANVDANIRQKADIALNNKVNAISATPSMFRAMLLAWGKNFPKLKLISLGGEIATQSILDDIKTYFPKAALRHIYATTETGVIFTVKDGLAGFPKSWTNQSFNGWQLKIAQSLILKKDHLQLDTGDNIIETEDRFLFSGRQDNLVNVGGVKVNLEALEHQIIALEGISDARVFAKANPITGSLVCIELCAQDQILARASLDAYSHNLESAAKPRIIIFAEQITLTDAGKKQRTI
ncbi:AMP-binding protein [Shewanella morhuae]|uniref:Long-chain-fatty-acid--CoA ligase n=1 Tax=Shewanella morhuae TaxID=365591 RepID=A0A380A8P1_9GAMM|nr:AMP-binding protein [Shewanella morhuae]SUI75999.1 long-chain-fatty-acid--CoA ligase [Shewanella morhuae]